MGSLDHSSAAVIKPGGTVTPSALAVFRLMNISNVDAGCTGKPPGVSPVKIRMIGLGHTVPVAD
jgi:hypothetical protein